MSIKRLIKIPLIFLVFLAFRFLNLFKKKIDISSLSNINDILIINFCRIGDVICTTPMIRELKIAFPKAKLDISTLDYTSSILINNPDINKTIPFPSLFKSYNWFKTIYYLKKQKYDLIIVPVWMLKNSMLALFLNPKYLIGYINDLTFTGKTINSFKLEYSGIRTDKNIYHNITDNLIARGLKVISLFNDSIPDNQPKIYFTTKETIKYSKLIPNKKFMIAIHPGAKWKYRIWLFERYLELLNKIIESYPFVYCILLGSKQDNIIIKQHTKLLENNPNIANYISKTSIRETAFVISKADLFIGSDSGLMHIACAVDTKILALFGPNTPQRTGPYGKNNIIIRHKVECSPCEQIKCKRKPTCMELITVAEVFEKVSNVIMSKFLSLRGRA